MVARTSRDVERAVLDSPQITDVGRKPTVETPSIVSAVTCLPTRLADVLKVVTVRMDGHNAVPLSATASCRLLSRLVRVFLYTREIGTGPCMRVCEKPNRVV